MPFRGFEGPAGSGKTYQLLKAVSARLEADPLLVHQRVLALTFMHGSRRRLEREFSQNPHLRGTAIAMTLDSFASHVLNRWRSLAASLDVVAGDFDQTCEACGLLLEQPQVARWVGRTFPVILVDEAQELAAPRLRMISALTAHAAVFVAADEFQCLDEEVDTGPFLQWFNTGQTTSLTHIHRTGVAGLLTAGSNLRQMMPPANGAGFRISSEFPNVAPFKIGSAIASAQGTVAVLYPPAGLKWARQISDRLAKGLYSARYNINPIALVGEPRSSDEVDEVMAEFGDGTNFCRSDVILRLKEIQKPPPWLPTVLSLVVQADRVHGKTDWTRDELRLGMERKAANYRAYSRARPSRVSLLGIHQAKNRQFDHVIVLWPHGVPGSDELKARLLYNGITRARRTCKVFVRTSNLLQAAPFAFA